MKTPILLAALLSLLLTPLAGSESVTARVWTDQADLARHLVPYQLNRIDRSAGLSAEQRKTVERILIEEADSVRALQMAYLQHLDIARVLKDAVDLNVATMVSLRRVLTPEQMGGLGSVFIERRDLMVNSVAVLVNSYWVEAAREAGFKVDL